MSQPDVLAGFGAYLAARDQQRAERYASVLGVMTKRERALVREVAVMAYVRGKLFGGPRDVQPPPDSQVLADVIGACLAMDDLYPTLHRLARMAARRAAS